MVRVLVQVLVQVERVAQLVALEPEPEPEPEPELVRVRVRVRVLALEQAQEQLGLVQGLASVPGRVPVRVTALALVRAKATALEPPSLPVQAFYLLWAVLAWLRLQRVLHAHALRFAPAARARGGRRIWRARA